MHVGIDITSIIYGRGVSFYTSNLVRALAQTKNIQLSLYGSNLRQRKILTKMASALSPSSSVVVQSYPPSVLAKLWQLGLNHIKKSLPQIDVFHSWDWLQPPDKNLPLVSTIHDLAILKYPAAAHPQVLKMQQRSWKILQDRQAEIITPSIATKKDVVDLLQIPTHRVHVIHEALPEENVTAAEKLTEGRAEQIKTRLQLNKPYLLFIGTSEPRKNLPRLIEAWQTLAADYELIIAGAAGWEDLSQFKRQKNLRFLGRVSAEELSVLYSEAEAFCYPSLDEGFGLPILEAFYYGVPVLTSNRSSMAEVAGNAALLVNPDSVDDIRRGLEQILGENKTEQQERLRKMILRLHLFSWKQAASETIKVYQAAINHHA